MEEGLKLKISADLGQTIAALREMQREVAKTGAGAKGLGDGVTGASNKMPQLAKNTGQANIALVNFGRVVQDAPFGLIGIANNIDPLISSFQNLKKETGSTGAAFKGLAGALAGPAGIAIAVSAVTSALIAFGPQLGRLIAGVSEYEQAIAKASEGFDETNMKVLVLVEALKSNTLTTDQAAKAQKELIRIAPEFQNAFVDGVFSIDLANESLTSYIDKLVTTIRQSAALTIVNAKLSESIKQVAAGGTTSAFDKFIAFFTGPNAGLSLGIKKTQNLGTALKNLAPENITKLLNETLAQLNLTYTDYVNNIKNDNDKTKEVNKTKVQRLEILKQEKTAYEQVGIAIQNAVSQYNSEQESLRLLASRQETLRKGGQKPGDLLTPQQQLSIVGSDDAKSNIQKLVEESNKLNKSFELTDELINTVGNEFANLFSNISKDGTKAFEDFAKAVAETTTRILINYAVTQALKTLIDSIAPGVGSAIGGAGRAFSNAGAGLSGGGAVRSDMLRLSAFGR